MTKDLVAEARRWANGHPNRRSDELMRDLADALEALAAPQEAKWEHGVIGGDDLLARLMDTLAYYHCRSVNPKADSPYMGYHAMSEDQREFLREKQRDAAEEVLRMWQAESRPPTPQEGDARERLHAKCDCVPDLGPAHCHLCSTEQGEPVPWVECSAVRDAAPEPEWEYGADFSKLSPMAGICTYPNSDDSGRAEAERVVKAARRTDKRVKLVRRRPAGPWKAVGP